MLRHIDKGIHHLEFAKDLRKRQTKAEQIIWRYVRAKRFHQTKFRRQVPVGAYIADFLCVGAKLVIEIDGHGHDQSNAKEYDRVRDAYFQSWGFRVLRFTNQQVLENPGEVVEVIAKILSRLESPSP